MIFRTKFTSKKKYLVKIGKKWTSYEFCIFEISMYQASASRIKFVRKGYFQSKKEKVNSTTEFHIFKLVFSLKWQFYFFWANLSKKVFQSKTEKVNITNEFWISKLVLLPNFSLNRKFWFFGPNLLKKGVSSRKQKKMYPTIECCIFK